MLYANVTFVPKTRKEVTALVKFLQRDKEYDEYRAQTRHCQQYRDAVKILRDLHSELYKDISVEELKKGLCLWGSSGLRARCEQLAEQFRLPTWDVIGDANSARPLD
jgi:hypothetical protein